jgi:hypothetical protein
LEVAAGLLGEVEVGVGQQDVVAGARLDYGHLVNLNRGGATDSLTVKWACGRLGSS